MVRDVEKKMRIVHIYNNVQHTSDHMTMISIQKHTKTPYSRNYVKWSNEKKGNAKFL